MVKKGAKVGKKKKPAKTATQAYDLETINKNDLKKYISSLEKELALMRQDCAFQSTNKDRVMEFLYAKKDLLLCLQKESVVKNTAMDDSIEQLRTLPLKKKEKTIVDDREESRKLMKNSFDDFVSAKNAEICHIDKEHALKQSIADQYRRLEFDKFLYEMTLMDANQRTQNVVGELEVKHSRTVANMLSEDIDEILKLNQEFISDKIETLTSVWDSGKTGATEAFADEIKRMQDFFHETAFKSSEVIKMLRDKLSHLIRESRKIELNLEQMRSENMELKRSSSPRGLLEAKRTAPFSTILQSKRNFESEKKLITLQYTNDILARYLHMIEENLKALKRQFTSALRKVYQRADFRTLLLEEQILSMLRNKSSEPYDDFKSGVKHNFKRELPKKELKIQDISNNVNVIKLNFENSDTLFVPPVYHEFWNSSANYL